MAVARHSENIEVQDEDQDHTDYENETTVTARRTNVEMSEGHYESLNLQKIDNAVYEDLRTKTRKHKRLTKKTQKSGRRPFRVVSVGLGMLCLILMAVNIFQAVHLNKSLTLEDTQLKSAYTNLTLEHTQLKNEVKQLMSQIAVSCPSGWKRFGSSCYYRTTGGTWQEGRDECRRTQGADLVVINSEEEQDFIRGLIPGGSLGSWIGLTRTEGGWTWVDGTPLTRKYWRPGYPLNGEDYNCAAYWHGTDTGGWSNYRCSGTWVSICEK